ncbi:MAG: hypothetical protein KAU38_06265 [Desulfobacterales bacterium]|nr:hypothetical protein [Desulfobacterales bacterium]
MATRREKITGKVLQILKDNPDGLRYSELVKVLFDHFGNIPVNTIHGTVWDLHTQLPDKIYKPSRGLFRLVGKKHRKAQGSKSTGVGSSFLTDFGVT